MSSRSTRYLTQHKNLPSFHHSRTNKQQVKTRDPKPCKKNPTSLLYTCCYSSPWQYAATPSFSAQRPRACGSTRARSDPTSTGPHVVVARRGGSRGGGMMTIHDTRYTIHDARYKWSACCIWIADDRVSRRWVRGLIVQRRLGLDGKREG